MRILFEHSSADRRRYLIAGVVVALGCSGTDLSAGSGAGQNLGLVGGQGNGASSNTTGSTLSGGSAATGGFSAIGGTSAASGATTSTSTGGNSGSGVPTWTQLYNNYFGPNTIGNCASCHNAGTSPTISSAATLCAVLKSEGYIQNGTATLQDLLTWFGGSGYMPLGGGAGPAIAVQDITAWQNAGAVCP